MLTALVLVLIAAVGLAVVVVVGCAASVSTAPDASELADWPHRSRRAVRAGRVA